MRESLTHISAQPELPAQGRREFLHLWRGKLKTLTRPRRLPMARVRVPADGSSVLHLCKRPHRCCFTCGYHAASCRHTKIGRILTIT
jgi:hypothetical protein